MTREQKRIATVANVVKRLRNETGTNSAYIQKILEDPQFERWLNTWVIPSLEMSNYSNAQLSVDSKARENLETALDLSR